MNCQGSSPANSSACGCDCVMRTASCTLLAALQETALVPLQADSIHCCASLPLFLQLHPQRRGRCCRQLGGTAGQAVLQVGSAAQHSAVQRGSPHFVPALLSNPNKPQPLVQGTRANPCLIARCLHSSLQLGGTRHFAHSAGAPLPALPGPAAHPCPPPTNTRTPTHTLLQQAVQGVRYRRPVTPQGGEGGPALAHAA